MSLAPGTRLGPYEILGPLGAGAMGEVYRARDPRIGREVAIKVLPAVHASDPDRLARFETEARAAGALNHPAVLTLYDVGHEAGFPYVVSELLEGATLRDRLSQGPLPPPRAAAWMAEVTRGLAAAHARGIVHRDLKPENLFVTRDGRVKILDFGLAKLTERAGAPAPTEDAATLAASLTETGMILGTAGYMAPEQVRGEPAGPPADLFALGAILHECLSGERAFRGASAIDSLVAILEREPPPLPAAVPTPLRRIVAHALEKEPERRFQSAADMAFALDSAAEAPVTAIAGAAAAGTSGARPAGRYGTPALLAALGAGLVLGAIALALFRPAPIPEPWRMRALGSFGDESAPAFSPDGGTLAFVSSRDGAARVWLRELDTGNEVALAPARSSSPRFSPDGRSLVFGMGSGPEHAIYRMPTIGGPARKVFDHGIEADWSPDGMRIVCTAAVDPTAPFRGTQVVVVGIDGESPRVILERPGANLSQPRWSPAGGLIAVYRQSLQTGAGGAVLVMAPDGTLRDSLAGPVHEGSIDAFTWSGVPGVLYLAVREGQTGLAGINTSLVAEGKVGSRSFRPLIRFPNLVNDLDAGRDGQMAFSMRSIRQGMQEVTLADGIVRTLTEGEVVDRQPSYSPDGRSVVFTSSRSGNEEIWRMDLETRALTRLTDHPAVDWDPAYMPEGRSVLFSSNRSGNYEIWMADADGAKPRQVTRDLVDAENPVPSPDGAWIHYSSGNPAAIGSWRIRPDGSGAEHLFSLPTLYTELSSDGALLAFQRSVPHIGVVRAQDGAPVDSLKGLAPGSRLTSWGRMRWMPGSHDLVYIGALPDGAAALVAERADGRRSAGATRRVLFRSPEAQPVESFGISPDGRRVVVSARSETRQLMLAERIPGVRGRRAPAAAAR
jgi:Tol biopolymer transport system component